VVIAVASGKGGTGKTTVSTNLALYLAREDKITLMDLDVEEPNDRIFLHPDKVIEESVNKIIPVIDYEKCTFCGKCAEWCEFNSLAVLANEVLVFPELCHSCGVCMYFCPEGAISNSDYQLGVISKSSLPNIDFFEGRLNIGEIASPEVIKEVKAYIKPEQTTLLDAPPGTSCSVVETIKGIDFCILVTEPTHFGLSDLKIMVSILQQKNIPGGIIINQYEKSQPLIDDYARENNIPVLARIPFDKKIAAFYSEGIPFLDHLPEYTDIFAGIIPQIEELTAK